MPPKVNQNSINALLAANKRKIKNWTYEKLIEFTLKDCNTGCLFWQKIITNGYGRLWHNMKFLQVHRFAWQLCYGPIPDELVVRHSCHNRACINVEHLSLGTPKDNARDCVEADRQNKGSSIFNSKLKEADIPIIKELLDSGMRGRDIAKLYKVSPAVISKIKLGTAWRHVS